MNQFVGADPRNVAVLEQQIPYVQGAVLEIGIGTGEILQLYDPQRVTKVYGLDPTPSMMKMARDETEKARIRGLDVELLQEGAEKISLPDDSVDTVRSGFTFCTIPALADALAEIRRVLKPDGQLVFWEHGLHADPNMQRWQRLEERLYHKWMFQGCHMTRRIPQEIRDAGFEIVDMKQVLVSRIPETWGYSWHGRAKVPSTT
jgi:ubiquinone/menaquinone biosynthesis C-methylase UbiE